MVQTLCKCGNKEMTVKCFEMNIKNKCREICKGVNLCGHKCQTICHNHQQDQDNFTCKSKCFK